MEFHDHPLAKILLLLLLLLLQPLLLQPLLPQQVLILLQREHQLPPRHNAVQQQQLQMHLRVLKPSKVHQVHLQRLR